MKLIKTENRSSVEKIAVVRNFSKVMEAQDISLMNKELYEFLHLHCGFIAHYDINGFKATYCAPKDFAGIFIRHFDKEHRYFDGIYACHEDPYRDTGFTKAEIKEEFGRIVELHKQAIARWAENSQRKERFDVYKTLKREFEGSLKGLRFNCEACGNDYEVKVIKEGKESNDFSII